MKMFDADKTRVIGLPCGETRSSAIADKPSLTNRAMLVCKVVEVWHMFIRFDMIHERDRQTDGQTDTA